MAKTAFGEPVCTELIFANSLCTRIVGLLGRRTLTPGTGMWLVPCTSVHTIGMRFDLDLVALDRGMHVVRLLRCVRPCRVALLPLRTRSVVELAAGQIDATGLAVGDHLSAYAKAP